MADTDLLDYAGLKHYDSKIKSCMWNWQKSKKAGAVTFKPVPESGLEPVVDFMFTETPPAEGEKGPENPSTITGVTQAKVTRCGKNLLKFFNYSSNTVNGVTCSADSNGIITLDGTASGNASFQQYFNPKIRIDNDTTVFCSYEVVSGTYTPPTGQQTAFTVQDIVAKTGSSSVYLGVNNTIDNGLQKTVPAGYAFAGSNVVAYSGASFNNLKLKVQVEFGSSKTSWESPVFSGYTIQLGDTYYGGSINLSTGLMTVTYEGVVIPRTNIENASGAETSGVWNLVVYDLRINDKQANIFSYNGSSGYNSNNYFCNYYPWEKTGAVANTFHTSALFAFISISGSSIENAKQNLLSVYDAAVASGNPISFVYPLAIPYTVQLTPTQIRSLPVLDKYEPRINTIYSNQEAVQIGYQRYADDPAPLWFVKDMLRANIEAMTSGRNTVVRDKRGNPHIMVVVPKFRLSDIDSNWASTVHPAFIVDGIEKSEILIGKFLASQDASGKVQTLPHQAPCTQVNFDNALTACRELGPNFCLNTNVMWAARVLWDYKRLGGSHEYLGNTNYGRDYTYHELTGVLKSGSYLPGDTSLYDAATLTGTGGPLWNDDGTESGIADLVGNVWEWVGGFRLKNGEIQIIPDNDASLADCDMTAASTEWKAILEDGTLVTPGTADTLKYDSANADVSTWANAGAPTLNTEITNSISAGYNGVSFKSFAVASGITAPAILKQLAMFPIGNDVQGFLLSKNSGESAPLRGGYWINGVDAGPFALNLTNTRSLSRAFVGFRAAYIV